MINKRSSQSNIMAKECIVTALIKLLKTKPLSSISITELTQRAGISRMTFYRNYSSKEDIIVNHFENIIENYRNDSQKFNMPIDFYATENLEHCFKYFAAHQDFLESIFKSGFSHVFLNVITRYVLDTWLKSNSSSKDYYLLQAFSGSLYNCYIAWANNGFSETPQELAEILHHVYINSR